jgi:SAM-dependent methyltransferase
MSDRERLRTIFGEDAERYDRARPGYPAGLFTTLAGLLGPRARVLELGAGTGKFTVPLAGLGARITAVELSPELAAVARRNLARHPHAEVAVADADTWLPGPGGFDAVAAATAWHWLDPATRTAKAAEALRPGGVLLVVATHHVAGGTEAFFALAQDCYERWDPATPPGLRLPDPAELESGGAELDASCHFEPAAASSWAWDFTYTTAEYLDVLLTYSGHRALEPARRQGLLDCLAGLIDDRFGGRITKRYLTELQVARRPA